MVGGIVFQFIVVVFCSGYLLRVLNFPNIVKKITHFKA